MSESQYKDVFVNFSNHPSGQWSTEQLDAARKIGEVIDVPFPNVDPEASIDDVKQEAEKCLNRIRSYHPKAVMCQGEFTLSLYVVSRLIRQDIPVYAACSKRDVVKEDSKDGAKKTVVFRFVGFREYAL